MKESIQEIYNWLEISENQFGDKTKLPLAISLVQEEFDELKKAIEENDEKEIKNAIVDIFWTVKNVAFFQGINVQNLVKEFQAVSTSNFSKFCKTEEEAIQSVEAYKNGTHPNKLGEKIETFYTKTNNPSYPFVVKRYDGKILKSINYLSC